MWSATCQNSSLKEGNCGEILTGISRLNKPVCLYRAIFEMYASEKKGWSYNLFWWTPTHLKRERLVIYTAYIVCSLWDEYFRLSYQQFVIWVLKNIKVWVCWKMRRFGYHRTQFAEALRRFWRKQIILVRTLLKFCQDLSRLKNAWWWMGGLRFVFTIRGEGFGW